MRANDGSCTLLSRVSLQAIDNLKDVFGRETASYRNLFKMFNRPEAIYSTNRSHKGDIVGADWPSNNVATMAVTLLKCYFAFIVGFIKSCTIAV